MIPIKRGTARRLGLHKPPPWMVPIVNLASQTSIPPSYFMPVLDEVAYFQRRSLSTKTGEDQ